MPSLEVSARNSVAARRYWLVEAANYYQVIRNFPEERDEKGKRLGKALHALDEVKGSIMGDNVETKVNELAGQFKSDYDKNLLSAASKFLWILHQSPVVIYDKRALTCLRWLTGKKITERAYVEYRKEWLEQFEARKVAISSACDQLLRFKDFAPSASDETELESVVKKPWFHERVFDKFLWWNGRSEEAPE